MALRRTHSSEHIIRLSRKDQNQKVTCHPGFVATSPRSSSAHSTDESQRSKSPSGFIHNLMAPMSSHLVSSGFSSSPKSKDSQFTPSDEYNYNKTLQNRSYHYNCAHTEQASTSRSRAPDKVRVSSKPNSRPSSHSPPPAYQRSRSSSQKTTRSDSPQPANYLGSQTSSQNGPPQTENYRSRPSSISDITTPPTVNFPERFPDSASRQNQAINHQMNVLKEKYAKLKEDYNAKMEEVSAARVELESAIKDAVDQHQRCEKAEQKAADLILRIKEAEFDKIKYSSSKDKIVEMESQLAATKQKHSESLEDVEEARRILKQQLEAVVNTRQLYLETEQLAEEQSRKLGTLESENERLSEQIALSMDQAREQFHLQVFELGPLADSVARLNESIMVNRDKKYRADKKAETLRNEISHLTSRNEELKAKLSEMRSMKSRIDKEKTDLRETIDSKQEERSAAKAENYSLRAKIKDLEELNSDKEIKISIKSGEVRDLSARLETLREECARQISSNKNTLMNARKVHLKRLTVLEKDLAKTKADENAAEKERDEIRQRLENQISSLSVNLCQAQDKIRNLQDSLGYINKDRNVRVKRISNPSQL